MNILTAICFGTPNKNTQIYTLFQIFSALGVKEPPLGFDNRLLQRF